MAIGIDLSSARPAMSEELIQGLSNSELTDAVHHSLRGSFTHTILEWTSVCIAFAVCVLAFVQYRMMRDPSLLIIGVALACAGAMDAFHTLAADRLIHAAADNKDLIPFTWAICRLFNGVIQLIGVGIFVLWVNKNTMLSAAWTAAISLGFIASAYFIVQYCATSANLPQTMFPGATISRPYDLYPLIPFLLCGLVVFPLYYRRHPSLFAAALILSMVPQIATQLYMAFGSAALHDSAFNIAHALKALSYLFPAAGLIAVNINAFNQSQLAETALRKNQKMMEGILSELEDQKLVLDQHAIVSIADIKGNITYANEKFCQLSGYTLEELTGQNHRLVKSDEHHRAFYRNLWKTISSGETWHGEIKNRAKDGTHYWVDATIVPFKNTYGKITQFVAIRTDITAAKESERRFQLAVNGSGDGLWDWDLLTDKVYYAPQWRRMLGIDPEETVTDTPEEWTTRIDPQDIGAFMQEFDQHLRGLDESFEVELRMIHAQGKTVWMLCRGAVVRDKTGRAVRVAGSLADITEIKDAQELLRKAAEHDRLTDLPNRELFKEKLDTALQHAQDDPSHKLAVLFFDFDRFKVINDSLGHNVGDALLIDIAKQFEYVLRHGDTAARFGGDEFVVLLNDLRDYDEAFEAADRLLKIFAKPHNLMGHQVTSTASIGLVTNEQAYTAADDMIRDADAAMYQAKETGKNQTVVFDKAMHEQALDRLRLETDLRNALAHDEIHLLYQPIIELSTGELSGFEALVRWHHPQRGIVSPVDFIPIAEDTGLIVDIGSWILKTASQQIADWNRRLCTDRPLGININVSKRQLLNPAFMDEVIECQRQHNLHSQELKLEITESIISDDRADVVSLLRDLRAHGCLIVMDDFGTGVSSLSTLHNYPIDILKIDQAFIRVLDRDRSLLAVVSSITSLAENLGILTVAEGVETQDIVGALQSIDCTWAQGYHFAKPLSTADAEAYILDTGKIKRSA